MRIWLYREPPPAWPNDLSMSVERWFEARGAECVTFDIDELHAGKLDADLRGEPENTLVFGGIGAVREALARAGRPFPDLKDFPDPLLSFAGRRIWDSTMKEIHGIVSREPERLPLHVKPHKRKLFKGTVVRAFRDLIPMAAVPDDEPVIMQEYVEFVSEWRSTILHGEILNVAHYKGDPLLFPSQATMKAAVGVFAEQPAAYALDWGVTKAGNTLLVEANDAHSLGNYGLQGQVYCNVLLARWRELMGVSVRGRP